MKVLTGLKPMVYEKESEKIDLFSLKKRRLKKDLIAVSMYLVEQTGNRLKQF